jgi:hypothetical protein
MAMAEFLCACMLERRLFLRTDLRTTRHCRARRLLGAKWKCLLHVHRLLGLGQLGLFRRL